MLACLLVSHIKGVFVEIKCTFLWCYNLFASEMIPIILRLVVFWFYSRKALNMCSIEHVDLIWMALWSRSTLIRFFEISETPSGVLRFNLSRGRSCCGWWQPFTLRRPHSIAHLLTTLRHFYRSTHSRYSLDCITGGILINLNEEGVNRHQFILNILWIILEIKLKFFSHLIFQRLFNTVVLIHWGLTFSRFCSGGLLSLLPYQIFYYSWTGKSYVLPILL